MSCYFSEVWTSERKDLLSDIPIFAGNCKMTFGRVAVIHRISRLGVNVIKLQKTPFFGGFLPDADEKKAATGSFLLVFSRRYMR